MKKITNRSLQSWSLPMRTPGGIKHFFLTPKTSIKVPASYITDHVMRFEQRRLISIQTVS